MRGRTGLVLLGSRIHVSIHVHIRIHIHIKSAHPRTQEVVAHG